MAYYTLHGVLDYTRAGGQRATTWRLIRLSGCPFLPLLPATGAGRRAWRLLISNGQFGGRSFMYVPPCPSSTARGMAAKRKEAAPEVVIEATARFYRATVRSLPSTAYARGAPRFGERALLTPGRGAHRNITCLCGGSRTGDAKSIGTTLRSSTTRWRCATATSSRASRFRPTAPGATIPKRRRSKSTAKTSRRCWSDISTHDCATSIVHTRTCMHRSTHACARALMCNAALLSGVRFSPAPPHPSPPAPSL
jgi:hypothetical protein